MSAKKKAPRDASSIVRLAVRVQPRATRTRVRGWQGEALKVAIAAPPVDGKANAELIRFLADALGLGRTSVRIASGEHGQNKIIEITTADAADLRQRLAMLAE